MISTNKFLNHPIITHKTIHIYQFSRLTFQAVIRDVQTKVSVCMFEEIFVTYRHTISTRVNTFILLHELMIFCNHTNLKINSMC